VPLISKRCAAPTLLYRTGLCSSIITMKGPESSLPRAALQQTCLILGAVRRRRGAAWASGAVHYAVLAASASFVAFQVHGSNLSSSWIFVCPETTRSRTSVNHANGSISFNFADTINVATIDQ
jgi:hypothetical protein